MCRRTRTDTALGGKKKIRRPWPFSNVLAARESNLSKNTGGRKRWKARRARVEKLVATIN